MDYRSLVLRLLKDKKYPKLQDYVVLDVYYKMIPMDHPSSSVTSYDRRSDNPKDVFLRHSEPFALRYMVSVGNHPFYLHRADALDGLDTFPTQCTTLKLNQSYLDDEVFHQKHDSFEQAIYRFLTLLNYDVPRVSKVLNMGFFASTRFLPQRIQLWVFKYAEEDIFFKPVSRAERACFGPQPEDVVPIRLISGRLSECKSGSVLLSLNNDLEFPHLRYTDHFSTRWQTLVPLAYNPLENPIVV